MSAAAAVPDRQPPRRGRPKGAAKPALTRARLVAAVVRLAEDQRETEINMRDLAHELGVSPKLLYRHVSGKEELLDLAAAALLETWIAPPTGLAWDDRLTIAIDGARQLIERFPALSQAVLLRNLQAKDSPEVARVVASIKGCFADAGLSPSEVDQVFVTYEALVLGDLALARAIRDGTIPETSLPDAAARSAGIAASLRVMVVGLKAVRCEA